ncbi:hypothetical protein SISSUDRAFT_1049714 [Sistotremastrum suecicum HHB10207 ss-3]|uniref:UBC core domain-containing protein n=1 Tax=Sistotremastrum suecicum HHB10207 ss-3 TaxID=1314776 RepID=A0A166BN77_9AGAM|nr:hypothetical protein SISSUDRAFT_1049714 [Sistotremastrum suecicum HHB10207 ss-3]
MSQTHTTTLFRDDTVRRIKSPRNYGVVLRCWPDSDNISPIHAATDPLSRPLQRGEVWVTFPPSTSREIVQESELTLVDRSFNIGSPVKRSFDDVQSGIVVDVETKARLEHAISGVVVPGWISTLDVYPSPPLEIGDYVIYDDWVGQIEEVFDESTVQLGSGDLVRVPELSARLTVGDRGYDVLPAQIQPMPSLHTLARNPEASHSDIVIDVQQTVLAISWLAINQSLDENVASQKKRPVQFWHGSMINDLVAVSAKTNNDLRMGESVLLRDPLSTFAKSVIPTVHGTKGSDDKRPGIEVRTMMVKETRTTVTVLWQDGMTGKFNANDLLHHLNPDEYECWPGDYVLLKDEGETKTAIVQYVKADQRLASVRVIGSEEAELVSVLQLDPYAINEEVNAATGAGTCGVRRGDFVFIHPEGTTNGLEPPRIRRIGESEAWVSEAPIPDEQGGLGGWRGEMIKIGQGIAMQSLSQDAPFHRPILPYETRGPKIDWFGEVTGLGLDGTIEVTLLDHSTVSLPLERLTKLNDAFEDGEDVWDDEDSDAMSMSTMSPTTDAAQYLNHLESHEHGASMETWDPSARSWASMPSPTQSDEWEDETMEVDPPTTTNSSRPPRPLPTLNYPTMSADEIIASLENDHSMEARAQLAAYLMNHRLAYPIQPAQAPPDYFTPPAPVSGDVTPQAGPSAQSSATKSPQSPPIESSDMDSNMGDEDEAWQRFAVLPEAPPDHAFFSSKPEQPNKTFMTRLQKEYRVLRSSLPETILVRGYEDRLDLLRILIIGPEGTPYEDAPFVIDWQLDADFPQSPPKAHFHSWTNGNGRVNPNLYEEGKVCLSILGTWNGDKSESWSATRSSLLQAFVSIQGLVLVKEPWFCEPAYEKLRGTDEAVVNSRLYSEKAYVLSRGFVRHALEVPPQGFEEELSTIYYMQGRLERVINQSKVLMERCKGKTPEAAPSDPYSPELWLTEGGVILLSKTLRKLEAILAAHSTEPKDGSPV